MENRQIINRFVFPAAGLLPGTIATLSTGAQSTVAPGLAIPDEYPVVHGWPILPEGEVLGSVAGVGVDSLSEVFVFHRAGRTWPKSDVLDLTPIPRPTVDIFDGQSGILLRRWGADLFAMPHGLTIDDHDNVWLTDVARAAANRAAPAP